MTMAKNILPYAEPVSGASRPWRRSALKAFVYVIACPLIVALPLLYAANEGWLPQHFLCCRHPELALLAFTGTPLVGVIWGAVVLRQILRDARRPRPRGAILAALAIVIGLAEAAMGVLVLFGLKA